MLDFGTDMAPREDHEMDDDLFESSSAALQEDSREEQKVVKKVETSAVIPPEEPKKTVRRPPVTPPTLPKYSEPPTPPPPKIQPVLRNNPHLLHRRRKAEEFSTEDKVEVSRILKAARKSAGLSVDDVEKYTQIRAHYVVALEEADYDNLPQPVYVLAYLRKLCSLYRIEGEEEEQLISPWRNVPCELPENLSKSVQQDEENENRKVLYRLEIILLATGALIIIGIVVLVVVLIVSFFGGKDVPQPAFYNTKLVEIQPKVQIYTPEEAPARR